jgi:hypothetical protein
MSLRNQNFTDLNSELLFIFTTKSDSKLAIKLGNQISDYKSKLEQNSASVMLVNQGESTLGFSTDGDGFLKELVPGLSKDYGENLIIFKIENGKLVFKELKKAPNPNTNWAEALYQYTLNYTQSEPENNYYKWGQIVPENGEYYCKDCGFVLNLEKGQLFPICESCLSGEPDGISGPTEGYWEKIS